MWTNCPTIIIGNFNLNMLTQTFESTTLKRFMEQYHSKLIFFEPITIYDGHLNHIWTNHQHNNLILDHLKHIGLCTNRYISHLNNQTSYQNSSHHLFECIYQIWPTHSQRMTFPLPLLSLFLFLNIVPLTCLRVPYGFWFQNNCEANPMCSCHLFFSIISPWCFWQLGQIPICKVFV